ncbi:glycosyl transferase group 1 [Candidatus Thiomargarita nelsonii]|uniref:Glycosyl transferase group 1 n=1 Tax=Candidatus Thiomargarita nelsonii TaxID=1003181 RepID=A0A176S5B8_9GAMM|nr:glycosyl transferase group 1 [Candidatus Thiomargarita nelsonii]
MTSFSKNKQNLSVAIVTSIHPDFDDRVWRHASSLAKEGLEIHLVCPWKIQSGEKKENVTFHTFKPAKSRLQRPFVIPVRVGKKLIPLLRMVDIVHFHDIDLLLWMALLSLRKKVVYDVHEYYAAQVLQRYWIPSPLRPILYYFVLYGERFFSNIIGHVVLVAPSQEKTFSNPRLNKIYVKNYATVKLLEERKEDYHNRRDAVIFIGSQNLNNGSMLFLEIAEQVKKARPNVKFYASDRFGNQNFREEYLQERRNRGLEQTVQLLPNVPPIEIASVLNLATIGINPTLRVGLQINGINTKLFEFMALGLPIITSAGRRKYPDHVHTVRGFPWNVL